MESTRFCPSASRNGATRLTCSVHVPAPTVRDVIDSAARRARTIVEHRTFQPTVIAVILVNAVTLGLETSTVVMNSAGGLLHAVDRVALAVFVADIALRLVAYGRRFWADPWNVFDFLIVAIALVPASGPFSVLRALR